MVHFRTCTLPTFFFKEYLKILNLTGMKQGTLWRMNDSSNISPTLSHTGNRMHNNWYKFASWSKVSKGKETLWEFLGEKKQPYPKQLNRLCQLSKVISFPSIAISLHSTRHRKESITLRMKCRNLLKRGPEMY